MQNEDIQPHEDAIGQLALCAVARVALSPRARRQPARPKWLGDDLPLPLPVKTPQDIGFKSAAERQYLIFNLMAGGKLAYQRGDYAVGGRQVGDAAAHAGPRSADRDGRWRRSWTMRASASDNRRSRGRMSSRRAPSRGGRAAAVEEKPASGRRTGTAARRRRTACHQHGDGQRHRERRRADRPRRRGGLAASGSTARSPRSSPPANQIVTQREKTFLPHVLAVPLGTTVQFRNDDRIYHNVFSIAKPNDFDAGIRATRRDLHPDLHHTRAWSSCCATSTRR